MSETHHQVIIIGGGPAGYVAAIRCAQLGLDTLVIDDGDALGGTCLNVGCIPSKALLDASEKYHQAAHEFSEIGIAFDKLRLDLKQMMARKQAVVDTLTQGIATLFKANKIKHVRGRGRLLPQNRVEITHPDDDEEIRVAEHVILASGSRSTEISAAPTDGERIVDSSGALAFDEVPSRLVVIGAGVIGLELGSVWARLGSQVTLLEAREGFLPMTDAAVSREALRRFREQGLDIRLGARVLGSKVTKKQVSVEYADVSGEHKLVADKVLVAVGRTPNSDGLAAAETELIVDEGGLVHVDDHCLTSIPKVWAIGDLVRGPMLAHKGSEEGVMVAERIAGKAGHVNYATIPGVIYSHPEIAWVGCTEQQLKAENTAFKSGLFPFSASGRARAQGATQGFVRVLADAQSDRLLGVHIIGPAASELIAEAVLAMEFDASSEDLARTIHAHPTLSEAVHEAALAVGKRAIHKFG